MSVRECAFKIFCDVMEKRNIEMTKTLCSRYVLWDLICASWCMWGIVIPKIFFILEWRKVWGSVHCGVSNGRNFLSHFCRMNHYIAHEASFYLLKAVGSQGRLSSILGSEEQSMFLRLCCTVLPLSFFVEKLKKHLSNYPSLYMYSKSRSFTLVLSRGGGLECSVFPGNFILKTYFLTERSN